MSEVTHLHVVLESGESRTLAVNANTPRSLADALADHDLPLNTRCGQRGLCRGCEVVLLEGSLTTPQHTHHAPATVQACRSRLTGDLSVRIPARSRNEHRPQVGESFEIAVPYAHQPLFAPVPGQRDTAFAVDIGTTTVVVLLVDLVTGNVLSRAGAFNAQIRFGDNVVTRIDAARNPESLAAMQRAIVAETLLPLLLRACKLAGRPLERIAGGALAGNTTMLHLLVGADPSPLGIAPFTPRFITSRQVTAREMMLDADGLAPDTPLQLLPGIAAYIGADITAGIYASGLLFDSSPSLLIDIGTNGEIVLQHDGKLTACATAAGPAFEGCGLSCGTRAHQGAVSSLHLSLHPFHLTTETIGASPLSQANGLCGSAYLDFLATARQSGLLNENGRFVTEAWNLIPDAHRLNAPPGRALLLDASPNHHALRISEVDVALLLQAKAAIGAGVEVLLETAGIRAADLGQIYLAGGFGMHLNVAHAIRIGLLPEIPTHRVRIMGNTSLAGALLTLVDRSSLDEMENLRGHVEVIELNLADRFEDRYIEHLMLP